ncbi:MAG: exonuclease SbcCD subunit D [Desulfurococcales archaeon]|nr:exonuclease SbcCD subunit D [Desulfurococcales archaeon]
MIIAHLADIHIGARKYGEEVLDRDIKSMLEQVFEILEREHITTVILAGDVFDKPKPSHEDLVWTVRFIKKCTSRGFNIIAAVGDHDYPARRDLTPLDLIAASVDGFYAPAGALALRSKNSILDFKVRIGNYTFYVLPYIRGIKQKREEQYKAVLSRLKQVLDRTTILVGHLGLYGHTREDDAVAYPQQLPTSKYVALGHIHNRIIFEGTGDIPPYAYPGSLVPLALNEVRHTYPRGPLIIDLSGDDAEISIIKVEPPRDYVILETELEQLEHYARMIAGRRAPGKQEPFVHLVLKVTGKTSPSKIRIREEMTRIREKYNLIIRLAAIQRTTPREETVLSSVKEDPSSIEKNILASLLGGDTHLAELVYHLKNSLAREDEAETSQLVATILSSELRNEWGRILGSESKPRRQHSESKKPLREDPAMRRKVRRTLEGFLE